MLFCVFQSHEGIESTLALLRLSTLKLLALIFLFISKVMRNLLFSPTICYLNEMKLLESYFTLITQH